MERHRPPTHEARNCGSALSLRIATSIHASFWQLIASGKKALKIKSSTWQTCCEVCVMPDALTGMSAAGTPSAYPVGAH